MSIGRFFYGSFLNGSIALPVVALFLSIIAVILLFVFIVPEKRRNRLNAFGKFLHDTLNFRYLIIEKILQALYILSTVYVIVLGFLMLFYVQRYYWGSGRWYGGYGILLMLLGPIAIRIVYELLMMAILVVKNIISINNKLSDRVSDKNESDPFSAPDLSRLRGAISPQHTHSAPETTDTPADNQ